MKKRFLFLVLMIVLVVSLFCINASAATYSGTCGDDVTWNLDTSTGELTISGTGSMTDHTSTSSVPWYNYRSYIETVVIGDGVTSIGDYAFSNCASLTSVEIPDSVTSIGVYSFSNCYALTSVEFPDSVTSIGDYAFSNCYALISVEIGDSVATIGRYAFFKCDALTTVTISDSVTSIGNCAFDECTSLTKVIYGGTPEQWNAISMGTYNKSLTSAYGEVGTCGTNVWWRLEKNAGELMISGTGSMMDYTYSSRAPWDSYRSSIKTVTIGDSVSSIGNYAFYDCSMTAVTIPDSVTSIGDYAFDSCSLRSVEIGDNVTSIGNYAFRNCLLTSVEIPDSVTSIGNRAFYNCNLTSLKIGSGVTSIGDYAFAYCDDLTVVEIGDSVTSIGNYAFADCDALNQVIYGGTIRQWKTISIGTNNGSLTSAYGETGSCGTNVLWRWEKSIGKLTISGTGSMKDYSSASSVPWYDYRSSIKTLTISDGVMSIGKYAFYKCTSLTSVEIPDSTTTIGNYAFEGSTSLTRVTIGDSVTSIGDNAFYGCSKLTGVTIPDSVTSIGHYAFFRCSALTDVTIGNSVTSIGDYAFESCPLTTVEIPDSVTSIGDNAFSGCSQLNSVTIPDGVTTIDDSTFYGCSKLTSVTIPDSVTTIGRYAFSGCSALVEVLYSGTQEQWDAIAIGDGNHYLSLAYDGFLSGTCGANLMWNLDASTGELTISGTGSMMDYSYSSRAPWDIFGSSIKTVTIGDSVSSIGNYAFYDCDGLTGVMIGNSVMTIGEYAFWGCSKLTGVTIGNSVTSIGDYAFSGCTKLTGVTIPDSVTYIGHYAFSNCSALTSVTIGDGVTTIGTYAFYYCSALARLTIGDNVTYIGTSAFYRCSALTSVTIGKSVRDISGRAFYYCTRLTSVTIPDSVTWFGGGVFDGCSALRDVYYCGTAEQWAKISIADDNAYMTEAQRHYMVWSSNATGKKTHISGYTCSECGRVLDAITEACTDVNEDGVCDLCGEKLTCAHDGAAGMYYTPNDDGKTHKVTVNCELCGEVMYTVQTNETCTDVDGFCSLCGQDLSCRHTQTEKTVFYTANKDGKTHKVTTVTICTICGEEVVREVTAEAEECTYSDVENVCTLCTQELPCRHLETDSRTVYADNEDRTHKVFACAVCLLCDEEVSRSVTVEAEPCTDEDDNDVCDKCEGDLYCDHSSGNKLIYISNQDGATHAVSLNCVVCMDVIYPVTDSENCSFTGGICTKCGCTLKEIEKFNVAGVNMTLGNELELNIMLPKSTVDSYGKDLTVTVIHHECVDGDTQYTFNLADLLEYGGGRYYKASIRVAAAQMTDLIDVVVTDEDGNVYNNDFTTSVLTYVTNNLDKQTAKVQTLLVDMVNYGAAAQDNFSYRQDLYANSNLTESQKALATGDVTCTDIRVKGTNYVGSNLSLQDQILLNFMFTDVADDATRESMYATVAFTGVLGNEVNVTVPVEKLMNRYAGVAVNQIVLADAVTPVTVTLYNADGSVYGYATDSVESYNARQNPNGDNALYTNIMKFAASALAYKNG